MKSRVSEVSDRVPIRNVLISVSDKSGLDTFVTALVQVLPNCKIYSTGGTFSHIEKILGADAEKHLVEVSAYTGQPETQGGLVKTLDFKIYLGILTEASNEDHKADLRRTGAVQFDMVVVNLYPFEQTIAKDSSDLEDARINIDIGGPTMLRASAKNFLRVSSVSRPADYPRIIEELRANSGSIGLHTRFLLAKASFAHTAQYDEAISGYLLASVDSRAEELYLSHGGGRG